MNAPSKLFCSCVLLWMILDARVVQGAAPELVAEAKAAMHKAADYYRGHVASHGGYVYFYSLDLKQRWGEGIATKDQIWVQPPGTPTVGLAFLKVYEATGDQLYLEAATAAAKALVYGQVRSGGWTNCIDFDPQGARVSLYRNGKGRGRNTSSLDDGQTQSAIRLLVHVDRVLEFQSKDIHEATQIALNALLKAQFPNGAFPQVWDDDEVPDPRVVKASYPDYDWRTESRIKNYWDMYTLNDNVAGYVAEVLIDAFEIYKDKRYLESLKRLGDFLVIAQMPEPQPGWAQQYSYDMKPIWARKFEPPAVAGDETQEAMETLMKIYRVTGDRKYLKPIPSALEWLKRSRLSNGQLARYYELKTNQPLYMFRSGSSYKLTYDDSRLPKHYGWKIESRLDEIERQYLSVKSATTRHASPTKPTEQQVRAVVASLDERGRWISTYNGEPLVGQPKMPVGTKYIASEVFSRNLTTLSEFLRSAMQAVSPDP